MRLRLAAPLLAAMVLGSPALAHAEPGDELTISVLTFGPGDHPFFKFGHNAIWVHDEARKRDRVFNYGTFLFDSPALIPTFLRGKLRYWLSEQSLRGTIAGYHRENRTIDAQEIDLSPAERRQMLAALEDNLKDENKYYKYDYYQDNCSTRVRDMVDRFTGGRLHEASTMPARMTWRSHTLRLIADDLPFYLGLNLAMGDLIDKPIDVWKEMFLPARLQETLRTATRPNTDGSTRPLDQSERRLLEAERAPVRSEPPRWMLPFGLAGLGIGGLLALLGDASRKATAARVVFGILTSLLGLVLGLLGLIFVMFWVATDHQVAHRNENILQCAPWAIVLAGSGIGVARRKVASTHRAYVFALAALLASALGLLAKLLPWFDQVNGQLIALLLPIWAGLTFGLRRLSLAIVPLAPAEPTTRPVVDEI